MKCKCDGIKRRSALFMALLAAIALMITAGGAFAADTPYKSTWDETTKTLIIKDILPMAEGGVDTDYGTAASSDLKNLMESSDSFIGAKGIISPGQIEQLVITEEAAPGAGQAYKDKGFFTYEDMAYIAVNMSSLKTLDLGDATVGAKSGDKPGISTNLSNFTGGTSSPTMNDLEFLSLPKGMAFISGDVFSGFVNSSGASDKGLSHIVFPETLAAIGKDAFKGTLATSLRLEFKSETPPVLSGDIADSYNFSNTTLVVPDGAKDAYKNAYSNNPIASATTGSVTLTAYAPTFAPITDGDTLPSPKQITVENSGDTSTTFTVMLNPDNEVFKVYDKGVSLDLKKRPSFTVEAKDSSGANGEYKDLTIGPKDGIKAGLHRATLEVNYNQDTAEDIVEFLVREKTPKSDISYLTERLIGLDVSGRYTVGAKPVSADSRGTMPISDDWMGHTVDIVKLNAAAEANSAKQAIDIPARPGAPKVEMIPGNTSDDKGKLIVPAGVEYRVEGATPWIDANDKKEITLQNGKYEVRLKSTYSAFASAITKVEIAKAAITLNIETPIFAPKTVGYSEIPFHAIKISNTGNLEAIIDGVTHTAEFELKSGNGSVPAGGEDYSWEVRPKKDLPVGEYKGSIEVKYKDANSKDVTAKDSVTFNVLAAPTISTFKINGVAGSINDAEGTISLKLPNGTDRTQLSPEIALTDADSTVSPKSGEPQDFTNPVVYTVKAGDAEKKYTVTVTIDPRVEGRLVDDNPNEWTASSTENKEAGTFSFVITLPLAGDVNTSDIKPGSLKLEAALGLIDTKVELKDADKTIVITGTTYDLAKVEIRGLIYELISKPGVTVYQKFDPAVKFSDIPKSGSTGKNSGGCDAGFGIASLLIAGAGVIALRKSR
ncbi:MAG: hypothetical protein LBQ58_05765 [Synergistaceae bacterium]|jgi:hypothetical protein|nr:hypothetical protein [Synergistaceae bacterium]